MKKSISISLDYSEELWNYLEQSTDCEGRLAFEQNDFEAILIPRPVAGLLSGQELITISTSFLTPFAISLFANWVYDLIKTRNAKINNIKGYNLDPAEIDKLERIIKKAKTSKKEKPQSGK